MFEFLAHIPNMLCWSILLIWILVGQRPTVLAVGREEGCLDIFSSLSCLFSFFLSPGDGSI